MFWFGRVERLLEGIMATLQDDVALEVQLQASLAQVLTVLKQEADMIAALQAQVAAGQQDQASIDKMP